MARDFFLPWLFGWVGKIAASLLFLTCRVQVVGREIETNYLLTHKGKGLLYASWHRGLMFFVYFYRKLQFVVMASASKDGELAAQSAKRFGWIPVRGSSTRRGSEALKEMKALFDKGHRGGLVVDAPTGPPYISKIGIVILAKRTRLPIVPVMWNADRSWRISSWDRSIIPKPFSKIIFLYGDHLIHVPKDASHEECEALRKELDEQLRALMFQTDHFFRCGGIKDPRRIDVPVPAPDKET
ncbi:MAG: lysophospholipid acyltransferase family protein [Proteobacteria bacterium]|nr:lysophospholipid acyltransferase family protein [Pseudomonadota bacterium]MBU4130838.1 lysophospholipid acyltransferase family protein [Pseudomonadota bacterium]